MQPKYLCICFYQFMIVIMEHKTKPIAVYSIFYGLFCEGI
jgi:hypothetical protein